MITNRRSGPEAIVPEARRQAAHELAIAALGFIASDTDELSRFLALSGIDPGSIRIAAQEPGFLGGVLAYISGNERTLLAFATSASVGPEEIEKARLVLTGGDCQRELP